MVRTRRRKLNIILPLVLLTMLFCGLFACMTVKAATDIRVGLKSSYFDKKIITVYNTCLKMGYCINDSFKAELELKSAGGFSFEPDKSEYYSDGLTYSKYKDAAAAASGIKDAYVCYAGRNKWMVYVKGTGDGAYSKVSSNDIVSISFGRRKILTDGNVSGGYPQFAAAGSDKNIILGSKKYRGRIEIGRYGNDTIRAINIVNVERYLMGVVSCEMNTTWHSEAQRAQAVAARSYCLANTGFKADSYLNKGYVIVDTDESQVYGGVNKETEISRYAVKSTLKQVLKSNGKTVPAYFFSTSGGATEFSADIWGGNSSVFIGVFDEYETNPERKPWIVKTTFSELAQKLASKGYSVNGIKDVYPEMLSDSGRVSSIKVKHSGGNTTVKGSEIKSLYGMHSTKFKIITAERDDHSVYVLTDGDMEEPEVSDLYVISGTGQVSRIEDNTDQMIVISSDNMINFPVDTPEDNEIWFLGMGWGHGIGMSQSGAYGLALKGFKYDEILRYYYKNTELTTY
ncbi:MAG: SpoIID/LytB domain-containing protein [Lachnospiraceae bacterium]|nr:SpoIID/LytB domain-containing protein [Lachnospiraceae bacterium]